MTGPSGIHVPPAVEPEVAPGAFDPVFVFTPAGEGAEPGRADLLYRDLIPSRLGGRFIASQISSAGGGPVADWVHYHRLNAQIIACRSGWARLVYEDQGDPFLFGAGDVVLQPPTIRHRVLETSPGFSVVEVASPAVHATLADPDRLLPTGRVDPSRIFGGQRFALARGAEAVWSSWGGFEQATAGLAGASGGRIEARRVRSPGAGARLTLDGHGGELLLGYVLTGSGRLEAGEAHTLSPDDAFVIPPGLAWGLEALSADLTFWLIAAPATYPEAA